MSAVFGRFRLVSWVIVMGVISLGVSVGRAEDTRSPTAPDSSAEQASEEKADPFEVPEGGAKELLAYMEGLAQLTPDDLSPEAAASFDRKRNEAIKAATARVLAAKPTQEQAKKAVGWRIGALMELRRMGDATAGDELQQLPKEVQQAGFDQFAREVRGFLLKYRLRAAMTADRKQLAALFDEIQQYLAQGKIAPSDAGLALMTAQVLDLSGNNDLAVDAYQKFTKLFAESDDRRIAGLAAKMEGAARRLTLVGKDLKLEGSFLDGSSLNLEDYRGKVVLVQFWATWCGPCRAEIVNIKKQYDLYHDRGFEVIGVNCDDDREELDQYLDENAVPWKNLFSTDEEASGMNNPMATYYGVMGIPTLILADGQGKVVALEVRGPQLRQQLEKLLGPIEEAETPAGEG